MAEASPPAPAPTPPGQELRFDVFGRRVAIVRQAGQWRTFYLGNEGKRRPADFQIAPDVPPDQLIEHLDALFHEHATPRKRVVVRLD